MKELTDTEIAQNVDAKSEELMQEFFHYRDEIVAENPDDPQLSNHRIIFESWAIQKIAGLQCLVLDLVKQVDELKRKRPRRK